MWNRQTLSRSGRWLPLPVLTLALCAFTIAACSHQMQYPVRYNQSQVQAIIDPRYQPLVDDLEIYLPDMMEKVDIPGLSLTLVAPSGIIWAGHFGVESTRTKQPLSDSTVFVAASFGKVVFSYLVLRLVEQGKLELDTPLIQYVPRSWIEKEYRKIGDDRFNEITTRMVLTHSTGFPDSQLFGGSVKISAAPGSRFRYSGEAFRFLQKIVEYIEEKPINTVMNEYVFDPLGMHDSSFVYEERFAGRMARGHGHWLSFLFNAMMLHNKTARAERSLLTTPADFARFLQALLQGEGLTPRISQEMTLPQINANSSYIYWGLGIGLEIVSGDTTYWHNGDGLVFQNYFAFIKNRIGFVYFSNSSTGLSIGEAIAEKILPGYHPSFQWLGSEQYDALERQLR